MPEITTTVKAKSEYGIKVEGKEDWWNWSQPEYRGTPFNTQVQAGDRVQITYAEKEYPDGKIKTFISTIDKVTQADVPFPPEDDFPPDDDMRPESAPDQQDGQFRSPKDFRRTSALAQAVAWHKDIPEKDEEDVILAAQRFEKYLGTGE